MACKILILGANGFIGSHLVERLLSDGNYEIVGLDKSQCNIQHLLNHPRFTFVNKSLDISVRGIGDLIRQSAIIVPLIAVPRPYEFVNHPVNVFELTFQLNLNVIRFCAQYHRRVVFPSTSEVYGLCQDGTLCENESLMVTGPIHQTRWIYSCSKQLLERMLYSYGIESELEFTIFRPFNWIGPRLDVDDGVTSSTGRVVSNFIKRALLDESLQVVNGGEQMRSFTYISDGISCLMEIILNAQNVCNKKAFNIGNPANCISIKDLAKLFLTLFSKHRDVKSQIEMVDGKKFYGDGYADIRRRIPNIEMAARLLDWKPSVGLSDALERTIRHYLRSNLDIQIYRREET